MVNLLMPTGSQFKEFKLSTAKDNRLGVMVDFRSRESLSFSREEIKALVAIKDKEIIVDKIIITGDKLNQISYEFNYK